MIRVLVADDQALVRGSFRLLVETDPGLQVIGEAATGAEAVEIAARDNPDVVLMDVRMPVMDGIDATRQITRAEQTAETRVLILTTFDLDDYVYAALRAGASGFLLKDTHPPTCWPPSGSSPPVTRCSPRRSPGGSSPNSPAAPSPASSPPRPSTGSPTGNARCSP
jgi:CheY-like chemotaxis protein